MNSAQLIAFRETLINNHGANIERYGHSTQAVVSPGSDRAFCYTIGLYKQGFELYCPNYKQGQLELMNEAAMQVEAYILATGNDTFLEGKFPSKTLTKPDGSSVGIELVLLDVKDGNDLIINRMNVLRSFASLRELAETRILQVNFS